MPAEDRHRGGASLDGARNGLAQVILVGAGGVFGDEFDVGAERGGRGDRLLDRVEHRRGLLMVDVLHLRGAHRRHDLQARVLGFGQAFPDLVDVFPVELDRNGEHRVGHDRGDRLDAEAVDLGLFVAFDFDHGNGQSVQKLRQFKLFLERKFDGLGVLGGFHGGVANANFPHCLHSCIDPTNLYVWSL